MANCNTLTLVQASLVSGMEHIGVAVLKEHLRTAAIMFTHTTTSKTRAHDIAESVAFVQGSGLELAIQDYHLALNADHLREHFFSWCESNNRS